MLCEERKQSVELEKMPCGGGIYLGSTWRRRALALNCQWSPSEPIMKKIWGGCAEKYFKRRGQHALKDANP